MHMVRVFVSRRCARSVVTGGGGGLRFRGRRIPGVTSLKRLLSFAIQVFGGVFPESASVDHGKLHIVNNSVIEVAPGRLRGPDIVIVDEEKLIVTVISIGHRF
ncbi:hypothetical protein SERLADRAFT_466054 [Serpula lacrymans var. lacrymans S7.9]|uniref:Uncharacterized protein n=1 Tax=Serpula lacrymans var. lacrymans (strain S7.9) TaxID=578457 RepID=F8NTE7_SERL9|nr:uncharacterized protein SERLADRAFT_466054 [Serpula lacrymans var. lacrymans S7.9]EGO25619.1 hypothetical protein SERLADRAFT_466054 [Serpula lacrymans var. lacrymans S7.9]